MAKKKGTGRMDDNVLELIGLLEQKKGAWRETGDPNTFIRTFPDYSVTITKLKVAGKKPDAEKAKEAASNHILVKTKTRIRAEKKPQDPPMEDAYKLSLNNNQGREIESFQVAAKDDEKTIIPKAKAGIFTVFKSIYTTARSTALGIDRAVRTLIYELEPRF